MLVLSRKLNQSIHIGDNISVSILRIKGNVIQLGIAAPKEVHVVRSELIARDAQKQAPQAEGNQLTAVSPPEQSDLEVEVALDTKVAAEAGNAHPADSETQAALFIALRVISESSAHHPQPYRSNAC